ncbi:MAG: response regulator [Acidimicrobiales bacterium]
MTSGVDGGLAVLMVEDDPQQARLMAECLRRAGLGRRLGVHPDGETALRRLHEPGDGGRPDLVLLDLRLPGLGGDEVLAEIKSHPDLRRIPVVVISGSAEPADVARAYALGANCYVVKAPTFEGSLSLAIGIQQFWGGLATLPP